MPPLSPDKDRVFKIITDPEKCELDLSKWTGSKGKDNLPKGPGLLTWDEEAISRARREGQNLLT